MKKDIPYLWIGLLSVVALAAILAPAIVPHNPYDVSMSNVLQAPSTSYIMGTDAMGRDVLSRIIYGGRVSLSVGVFSMIISTTIGVIYGGVSGYCGGRIDNLLMRLLDTFLAIPNLIIILALQAIVRGGLLSLILIIGCTSWLATARIVRSQFAELREKNFVQAAIIVGTPAWKIICKHLLMNSLPAIIVIATLNCAQSIFMEVSLSFLGIGVPQGTPSWGDMLNSAQSDMLTGAWWIAVFPGLTIVIVMLSINYIGEWLKKSLTYA